MNPQLPLHLILRVPRPKGGDPRDLAGPTSTRAVAGRGKRGGARIIYYWYVEASRIYLLLLYAKNERDDLSPGQKRMLRKLVVEG